MSANKQQDTHHPSLAKRFLWAGPGIAHQIQMLSPFFGQGHWIRTSREAPQWSTRQKKSKVNGLGRHLAKCWQQNPTWAMRFFYESLIAPSKTQDVWPKKVTKSSNNFSKDRPIHHQSEMAPFIPLQISEIYMETCRDLWNEWKPVEIFENSTEIYRKIQKPIKKIDRHLLKIYENLWNFHRKRPRLEGTVHAPGGAPTVHGQDVARAKAHASTVPGRAAQGSGVAVPKRGNEFLF